MPQNYKNTTTGIDIGSDLIRVVITKNDESGRPTKVIGMGLKKTNGVKKGHITEIDSVAKNLLEAIKEAENQAKVKVKKAVVSVKGITLMSEIAIGSLTISKPDGEITETEINTVIENASSKLKLENKEIIQTTALAFRVDKEETLSTPIGLRGSKIEVKSLFATCSRQHISNLINAVNEVNVEVVGLIASPQAEADYLLPETQKKAGATLVNVGAETTTLSVFEDNKLQLIKTIPMGSNDIIKDIALVFQIPLEEAQKAQEGKLDAPKKKLEDTIDARIAEIFELINEELKKIGRNELLPAGVKITGTSIFLDQIENSAKNILHLPVNSSVGKNKFANKDINNPIWHLAYSLCFFGNDENNLHKVESKWMKKTSEVLSSFFRQFMP